MKHSIESIPQLPEELQIIQAQCEASEYRPGHKRRGVRVEIGAALGVIRTTLLSPRDPHTMVLAAA